MTWPAGARRTALILALAWLGGGEGVEAQDDPASPLLVFHAGSLRRPFESISQAFQAQHPGSPVALESSASVDAVRKLTDQGRVPDLLVVADYGILPRLVVPRHAGWYVQFARNAMGLLYTGRSRGAGDLARDGWWRVLLRDGVRIGMSDPTRDPAGYRALLVLALAERHYREPGLAARLRAAIPAEQVRSRASDLVTALANGDLDYAFEYRSVAQGEGLRFLALPDSISLGSLELAEAYAGVQVTVDGGSGRVTYVGEPIVYGLTIPREAPHREAAGAFGRLVLSAAGRAVLEEAGLDPLFPPAFAGAESPPASLWPPPAQ
jgi:molybdate/tungstate transport system substrate-binding protein